MVTSPRKTTVVLLCAVLLLGGALWFASSRGEPAIGGSQATRNANNGDEAATPATSSVGTPARGIEAARLPNDGADATRGTATTQRDLVPGAETTFLRVVLRGVHAEVPWTTPLRLEFVGLRDVGNAVHSDEATPDAEGRVQFALPAWWPRCRHGRITASDPRYRSSDHRWMGSIDPTTDVVVDVQVVSGLAGRVVDPRGDAVLAHVVAFPFADAPKDIVVGRTTTNPEGEWSMQVAPDQPLLLVAQPMQRSREVLITSWSTELADEASVSKPASPPLPASQRATCRAGEVTTLPDFVLPDALELRGVVRWTDGAPVENARVQIVPRSGVTLTVPDSTFVQWHPDGRVATSAQTRSDATGRFVLPMLAGTNADVRLLNLENRFHLANRQVVQPVSGASVEFRLPRPVTLRAVSGGTAVPGASFEVQGWNRAMRAEDGVLAIVPNAPARIRAKKETRCSRWFDSSDAAAGKTVDLELEDALRPVELVFFDGAWRLGVVDVEWRSSDGREGLESVRAAENGAAALFLEPGHYRLSIGSREGSWSHFLQPFDCEFSVGAGPVTVRIPARVGGVMFVHATDANGLHVAGTCRVRGANEEDVTDAFAVDRDGRPILGEPGHLLPEGPNRLTRVLPPGEYELLFEFPKHGSRRERVTIHEGHITNVRVRL